MSKEVPKLNKNRSLIEQKPSEKMYQPLSHRNNEKHNEKTTNKPNVKSKLVESIFGNNDVNIFSRNHNKNVNLSSATNHNNSLPNESRTKNKIEAFNKSLLKTNDEVSKPNCLKLKNLSVIKEKNMNVSTSASFHNSLRKRRSESLVEKSNKNTSLRKIDITSSFDNANLRKSFNEEKSNIKETLLKIIEENSNGSHFSQDLIENLIQEIGDNIQRKSKTSTRELTACSSSNDNESVENMHLMFVTSYQKYKKIVSNQENASQKSFSSNDKTVVLCDEIELN